MLVIIMGVSGTGKTTVGKRLAALTGWTFYDGDDFQPPANIAKMHSGQPLTDADRAQWLERLTQLIQTTQARGDAVILACSALKQAYRDTLRQACPDAACVYLEGDPALIRQRLQARQGHFFGPELLASQLQTWEPPTDALRIDITATPEQIAAEIKQKLHM